MTISSGETFRAVVTLDMPESQIAQIVLGLLCESGSCTDAQLLTAAATWLQSAFDRLDTIVHDQVDIQDCVISEVAWSVTYWEVQRLIGTCFPTFAPTNTGEMLPHACSAVITMPTVKPKKRGRINIPGLAEDQQSDSLLVVGAATALANFGNDIKTAFAPGSASMLYVILGQGGTVNGADSVAVNGIIGSQRRRKPGVGI